MQFYDAHVHCFYKEPLDLVQKGYKAVKILYIPEMDESLEIKGWERVLGRTVS
jgi:hypothetical protein